MKEKLNWQKIYIIFMTVLIIMIIAGGFLIKENKFNLGEENSYTQIFPIDYIKTDDGKRQYTFNIDSNPMNNYLMFYTNHQDVYVYADNELVYERTKVNTIWGHTTGAIWNIMSLPLNAKELVVIVDPIYKSGENDQHVFYYGNGINMLRTMVYESIPSLLVSILLIIFGLFMILYWILICYKSGLAKELLYMGIFVLLTGAWAFGEANASVIILDNRVYASFITFSFLMLMGITFMLFIKHYHKAEERYFHKILTVYSFAGVTLMIILQALNIWDFKESVFIVHITLVCDLFYMLSTILDNMRKGRSKRNLKLNIAGLIVLAISVAFELYAYYAHLKNVQSFAMFGLLVYIAILGLEIGADASEKIDELRKSEIYKELAEKDILTKCFNRNSYNEDIKRNFSGDTYIIMLDLNNLKKCNDTLGHMEGDRYLTDSAQLIKKIFSKHGKVYRIGGDEFCIIMEYTSEDIITTLIQQLNHEEAEYNKHSQIHMQIASGYARYDAAIDADLERTRCRADVLMYENKKQLKAANKQI